MAINLSRNTKVYFTTNVNQNTGVLTDATTGFTAANLIEIGVLDGYSFTQGTQQQTITIAEGGNTPVRGQRSFNTQVDPVDFSFSTYIRPNVVSTQVVPQERVLWNALFGSGAVDTVGTTPTAITRASTAAATATVSCAAAITSVVNGTTAALAVGDVLNIAGITAASQTTWNQAGIIIGGTVATGQYIVELAKAPASGANTTATVGTGKVYTGQWATGPSGTASGQFSYVTTMASNKNLFQRFGMIFVVDSVVYGIDNCFMDQVSVDFALDAIATGAWSGKGTALKQMTAGGLATALAATATANPVNAPYITNKLSTMKLESNIGGSDNTATASVSYAVAITGGNVTVANNVSYLVPANLGVVNSAIGYFPGQRSISGNVTAYLRTGETNSTGDLLRNLLANISTAIEPKFRAVLEMGGGSNATRVEFDMPGASLSIPSVDVADVVSTTINFNAQAFSPDTQTSQAYDLTKANELQVRFLTV